MKKTLLLARLCQQFPLVNELIALHPVSWFPDNTCALREALPDVGLSLQDVQQAHQRLQRFAPYLAEAFPETTASGGLIE